MQKYSKNLIDIFYNTQFAGAISGADVIVKNEDIENNEVVKIYLVVRNDVITDCSFQAKGSIVLYASLNSICSIAKGKLISEVLTISEKEVINDLKQLNKQEYREIVFALESFKKAIYTYSRRKAQGTIIEKNNLKSKILHPSKNITRYESVATTSEIEKVLSQKDESVDVFDLKNETIKSNQEEQPSKVEKELKLKAVSEKIEVKSINKNEQKLDALINEVKLEKPKQATHDKIVEEDSELMIVPVGGKKKQRKTGKSNVVIPTKIEVRVLDGDEGKDDSQRVVKTTKVVTTTTKTVKKEAKKENPYLIQAEPERISTDDEVIDEIDSITEQLTNAISQLNFKFDDDDKN